MVLLIILLSNGWISTQKAAERIHTAKKIAIGTGSTLINSPQIIKTLQDTMRNIKGEDGLLESIKTLGKINTEALINGTNKSIFVGIISESIIQELIKFIIQTLPIENTFMQAGYISKKTMHIFENINTINTLTDGLLGNIFLSDTPEIIQNTIVLLHKLSEHLINFGTFFKNEETNVNESFLNKAKDLLHKSVDQGIQNAIKFDKELKLNIGIKDLSELLLLTQEKHSSSFHRSSIKIEKLTLMAINIKLFVEDSMKKINEYTQAFPDIINLLNPLITDFINKDHLTKIIHVRNFIKEISIPIEGILILSILVINEFYASTEILIDTFISINHLFNKEIVPQNQLKIMKEIMDDSILSMKLLLLLYKNVSLQSDPDALVLIYLRQQVQNIANELEQKELRHEKRKQLPKGGKQLKGLKKIMGLEE